MNIVVTGGAGFIGSNLLRAAVAKRPDDTFINLDALTYAANPASLAAVEDRSNYRFELADLVNAERVDEVLARYKPSLVMHLAAETHVDRSILGPGQFIQTNVVGTFNLLESFRRHRADDDALFHLISTDEVYGSLGPEGLFTEETAYDPSSPYSASKASADHLVRAYGRTYGLPYLITNCSNNYGPYQFPEKLIPLMILNALKRRSLPVYGAGLNVRDWLYVEDHCEALWTAIERGQRSTTYNVGGNCERQNLAVVEQVCKVTAQETGAPLAELTDLITHVEDRPGHDLRYAIDSSKLQADTGWRPKEDFDSGLRKTVRWYLENAEWVASIETGQYEQWIGANYTNRLGANATEGRG